MCTSSKSGKAREKLRDRLPKKNRSALSYEDGFLLPRLCKRGRNLEYRLLKDMGLW